ncbi:hypothetical protein CDAR_563631 [Caerostris darwini]|uniref:PiggyBac transposable element-derived protein domain-containing protein n=1 Tax=Caerostris darwini TaxID=1538125 RepID=A0AAV4PL76_9ARAC|nr:hypothetical protein CDAR_563631 [Caerostris darwini]
MFKYRTTETFRDEPWPSTEKLRSPSGDESITILPQLDSTSYLIITESETTKPSLDQIITYEEFEPFQKSEDSLAELTAEVMNYTHNFSHIDDFAKDTSSHFKLLVLNAFAKFKNKLKQQNIGFADSQTVTSDQYKRDFSKQANLLRRKVKASSFRKRSVKDSRKTYSRWTNGLYALAMSKPGEKMGYCGRCWRANYLPFKSGFSTLRQPYITRAGTPYGPPKYLMPLCQYVAEYESSMQSCV